MVKIEDLTGIPKNKRSKAISCLDSLLTFKDKNGILSPIISGYNWYTSVPKHDSTIIFSNMHATKPYKSAMLEDLEYNGYDKKTLKKQIRAKSSAFLWNPAYRIRDDKGKLFPLKIKNSINGQYIPLKNYDSALIEYPEFLHHQGNLVAEGRGWEIDVPFQNKKKLFDIAVLFLKKASVYLYDKEGEVVQETEMEISSRSPWPDAYKVPVLIIGNEALKYRNELPHFDIATKIVLVENNNEISFIIHKHLDVLQDATQYNDLQSLGFIKEECLGNKRFLIEIDDIR